jgi:hypothetical protein
MGFSRQARAGWPITTVPGETAAAHARQLTAFQIAMTLRRIDEHNSPARRSTNLIVAACPRGRSIRATASMQVELVAAGNSSC